MEVNLDDWCQCTTDGVVTEEDKAIQHMMQMDFPLSDPRGHLVRPRKVLKYDGDMPYYDIVLCPVDDITAPKVYHEGTV